MEFITCDQMKNLEKCADAAGLSYYTMMENAGSASAELIENKYESPISDAHILFLCGKGNNGGDGFVAARKLLECGSKVTVFLVDGLPTTKDALTNYNLLRNSNARIINPAENQTPLSEICPPPDILVDAVCGTGFHGALRPNALKAADFTNRLPKHVPVFSLDIPSGMGGDCLAEEDIDPNTIRADFTLTFHKQKPVHTKNFARRYCGEIITVDIGIDEKIMKRITLNTD